jgi:polysaccharide pyruvyl transferase WcaK-like protein
MLDKIYVIGYYGYRSLGDEAMKLGLDEILRHKGYQHIRYHKKGIGYIKNFLWADAIVLGGGTHMRDWGTKWLSQSLRILALGLLSKAFLKRFYMLNVGIDGNCWLDLSKKVSNKVTLRDIQSFDSSIVVEYNQKPKKKILGVSLSPVFETYYKNKTLDEKLAIEIARKIRQLLDANPDWVVKFFNFNKVDEPINLYCSGQLSDSEFRYYDDDVKVILSEVSECSAFIGMRYHSCQFAYKTQTPLLVINSYPSCGMFARLIGVKLVSLDDALRGRFNMEFRDAKLPINYAKSLAFKGVDL